MVNGRTMTKASYSVRSPSAHILLPVCLRQYATHGVMKNTVGRHCSPHFLPARASPAPGAGR